MRRFLILLLLPLSLGEGPAHAAADSLVSPVFKRYRPPRPATLLEQSDITYQLWHTFNLTQNANGGDVLAMQELAVRYLVGKGLKADTVRGAYWTARAAARNLQSARFNLGVLLTNGWGVEWNPFEAYRHFVACAERGMPEAQYVVATFLTENLVLRRDPGAARRWLKAAADSGYAPAAEMLEALRQERGEPPETPSPQAAAADTARSMHPAQALGWTPVFLNLGADTGKTVADDALLAELLREASPELQRALGIHGPPASVDDLDAPARSAVLRAAEAGSPEALTVIGRTFELGAGVDRDRIEALSCYVRALRLDAPRAPQLLTNLLEGEGMREELRKRMRGGEPAAAYCIAALAGLGIGDPLAGSGSWVGLEEGVRLLAAASRKGYVPAMIELGLWRYAGRGGPKDAVEAKRLWAEAAARGSLDAEIRIAVAELQDSLGAIDLPRLFRGMAEGSVIAQMALGVCYESGRGVGRKTGEAASLYRSAARRGSQDGYRALLRLHDAIRPAEPEFAL